MSSVKKDKPEIQQIYTDAYRWRRYLENERWRYLPIDVILGLSDHYPAFVNALISHDNARREFDGWINPYRRRQFRNLKMGWPGDNDIPF